MSDSRRRPQLLLPIIAGVERQTKADAEGDRLSLDVPFHRTDSIAVLSCFRGSLYGMNL